jgi:hypothetical protein
MAIPERKPASLRRESRGERTVYTVQTRRQALEYLENINARNENPIYPYLR